ncbi:hypothetical protein HMPREF0201_01866 [Cedecea davisae DSM 4568]|uniref:Uncharacterized protein n=1 Tax=Cedecea davisae DSM 4568 TaxID=566551 RepID=S3JCJ2_9ENTR|nr:hypothetical protein HMPREF0201_01866 [Cedecea davisae DSM 4568]
MIYICILVFVFLSQKFSAAAPRQSFLPLFNPQSLIIRLIEARQHDSYS